MPIAFIFLTCMTLVCVESVGGGGGDLRRISGHIIINISFLQLEVELQIVIVMTLI